ncbi:hypothetical protein SCP_0505470 [Sparassis crispa]|uniref:Uncharacterized protein n=1 Tax=Sparassis crispa TaxID=139825 RepID=A0A401GMQ9_9APHY|nr:hypothetical protein SCP_0505470 [Sparassis crispa]GBE83496.1 hypothetical protein SCP_0505470 [Sparassis crispa]
MSTRPPPVRGGGALSFVSRSSLRPVVISIGVIAAIWSLIWAIGSFQTISTDKNHGQPKLASLAIVLGAIYVGVCVIEVLGIIAASVQHRFMVRVYALLSVVSSFAIVGAALVRVIVHFILKNDLISECETIVQGDEVFYQFGFWGPTYETKLTLDEATSYCKDSWNHDSFVEIIMLVIELLLSIFFTMIAFAYYRQVLDPTSAANVSRRAPATVTDPALESEYPSHYNPPYLGYDAPSVRYSPPPGMPPAPYDPIAKPPDYADEAGYGVGKGLTLSDTPPKGDDPFADFEHREAGDTVDKVDPFADTHEHGPGAGESRFVEERESLM